MEKKKGSISMTLLIALVVALMAFVFMFKMKEGSKAEEVEEAKFKIAELYKKYATLAFDQEKPYYVNFDYDIDIITVLDADKNKLEEVRLPKAIKYATVYGGAVQQKIEAKITEKGNISPVFSVYIFDRAKIAKYRVSMYGFDALKHIKINIYKNISDLSATYNDILAFHNKFQADTNKLWEKE